MITAAEFARAVIAVCYSNQLDWEALANNTEDTELAVMRRCKASQWKEAIIEVKDIAAQHNIDLSEPTP